MRAAQGEACCYRRCSGPPGGPLATVRACCDELRMIAHCSTLTLVFLKAEKNLSLAILDTLP